MRSPTKSYKGILLDASYRLDFVVEDMVVVEVKSVTTFLPVHEAQLLTYLRLSEQPAGLLINFNVAKLVDGVKRVINPKVANLEAVAGPIDWSARDARRQPRCAKP